MDKYLEQDFGFDVFEGTGLEIFRHALYARRRSIVKNSCIILGAGIIALVLIFVMFVVMLVLAFFIVR